MVDIIYTWIGFNLAGFLFISGLCGIFWNRRNFLLVLLNIELTMFSTIVYLIFMSSAICNPVGLIFVLFIISLTAVETAIGLSLLILLQRFSGRTSPEALTSLRG